MSVTVTVAAHVNGTTLPLVIELDDETLRTIASATAPSIRPDPTSPYMTIVEAAEYLRCSRQRVDDLLSQHRLTRHKDGTRTLVSRAEVEAHLTRPTKRTR